MTYKVLRAEALPVYESWFVLCWTVDCRVSRVSRFKRRCSIVVVDVNVVIFGIRSLHSGIYDVAAAD